MALSDRVTELEKRVAKLEDTVMEIAKKVFDGFGEKIDNLVAVINELKTDIKKDKARRLSNRDIWIRSAAISVGGGTFVGVVITLVKEILPKLF